jgi:hypothetical protein
VRSAVAIGIASKKATHEARADVVAAIAVGLLGLAGARVTAFPDPASATIASVVDDRIASIGKRVVDVAEGMPEDKYSFAPTNGEFKGVIVQSPRSLPKMR